MSTHTPAPPASTQAGGGRPRRRRWWLYALIAAVVIVVVGAVGIYFMFNPPAPSCAKAADPTRSGAVTEYCPGESYQPFVGGMAFGQDGNLWYTDINGKVARLTPTRGAITEFTAPTAGNTIGNAGLVRGVDGNLWYIANDQLGRISMSGEVKEFALPKELGLTRGIAAGTDGTLWVIMTRNDPDPYLNPTLLKITIPRDPTGAPQIAKAPLPAGATVGPMTGGPDGNLWMATSATVLTRITPAGGVTQFPLNIPGPAPSESSGCGTGGINCKGVTGLTAGPDGNLWFTDGWSQVGRMTLTGAATFYRISGVGMQASIGAGPDGNVWFSIWSSTEGGGIARITPAGAVTKYSLPHADAGVSLITAGPDGGVWFVSSHSSGAFQSPQGRITRLTP